MFIGLAISTNLSAQIITINNITQGNTLNGVSEYLLGKLDPHLTYSYSEPVTTDGKFIELAIEVDWLDNKREDSFVEIFWSSGSEGFDAKHRVRSPLQKKNSIIQLPVDRLQKSIRALRIDFEKCDCRIKMAKPKWRSYAKVQAPEQLVDVSNYLDLKNGKDITLDKWVGAQLKASSPGVFLNRGNDPRIVNTEDLALPLSYAAGVYFDFDFDFQREVHKYQLFWLTKNSGWSPRKSAYFALLHPPGTSASKKVFIPFDGLYSTEQLQRLRLDMSYCQTCPFVLKKARIVGWNEVQHYQEYTPELLYYVNTQRPSTRVVAKNFLQKLAIDVWFNIFFVLSLLSVGIASALTIIRR